MNLFIIHKKIIEIYRTKLFFVILFTLTYVIFILVAIAGLEYWFAGSVLNFKYWYPNYGFQIWLLKTIILLIYILNSIYLVFFGITYLLNSYFHFKKVIFYLGLIFLTFAFNEVYPISFYPMYNHFPNWSYSYYFSDEKNNIIKHKNQDYIELTHQCAAIAKEKGISYGYGSESEKELYIIGQELLIKAFRNSDNLKINLFRIYNYLDDEYNIISDTVLMVSTYEESSR